MTDMDPLLGMVVVVLETLEVDQFVLVEFEPAGRADAVDPLPYSQAARSADAWYLEVASDRHLPVESWPIDEGFLRVRGFCEPGGDRDNWWRTAVHVRTVAGLLIDALVTGRRCRGKGEFHVSIGTFPPSPDGGDEAWGEGMIGLAA
jgi:hypothetical protein